jgi:predicted transcriptional regulator
MSDLPEDFCRILVEKIKINFDKGGLIFVYFVSSLSKAFKIEGKKLI